MLSDPARQQHALLLGLSLLTANRPKSHQQAAGQASSPKEMFCLHMSRPTLWLQYTVKNKCCSKQWKLELVQRKQDTCVS